MPFNFLKEYSIKIHPLSAPAPLIPGTVVEALAFLASQRGNWNQFEYSNPLMRSVFRRQTELIEDAVRAFREFEGTADRADQAFLSLNLAKLKEALDDPDKKWVDTRSINFQELRNDEDGFVWFQNMEYQSKLYYILDLGTDRYSRSLDGSEGRLRELRAEFENLEVNFNSRFESLLKSVNKADEEVEKGMKDASAKLIAFKRQFEEHLKLSEPERFFRWKTIRHHFAATVAFLAFLATVCLPFFGLYYFFNDASAFFTKLTSLLLNPSDSALIGIGYFVLAAPVVLLIWTLRLVVRIFIMQLKQAVDADQRRMALFTFLALVGQPNAKMSPEERVIFLKAMARPSGGEEAEEVMPGSIGELVAKFMESRSNRT